MRSVVLAHQTDFAGWRIAARRLILDDIRPEDVNWSVGSTDSLFTEATEAGDPVSAASPTAEPSPGTTADDLEGTAARPTTDPMEPVADAVAPHEVDVANVAPPAFTVPRSFLERCTAAVLHSDVDRFAFLYRVLWRLRRESGLMEVAVDPDIVRIDAMVKAVRRDLHKMKAYVRFREVVVPDATSGGTRPSQNERAMRDGDHANGASPWFVAWFEPAHHIVEAVAPFFTRRFTAMRWAILTPERSASWDGATLSFGPGAHRSDAPDDDALEDLWRTYYANIFNPARLKLAAMQGQMPKKYWKNLPEAELIAPLAASAQRRMQTMIDAPASEAPARTARVMLAAGHAGAIGSEADQRERTTMIQNAPPTVSSGHEAAIDPSTIEPALEPPDTLDLPALAEAARGCRACSLWEPATQTVFGEGPGGARIVVVGEQPGDQEDLAGRPFVGPAGQLFDRALREAGIDRKILYVTNAVKHFSFVVRGKRRMHQTPKVTEIKACRPWIDAEIARIAPTLVVAMGASAAQSVFGRVMPVQKSRRQFFEQTIGGHRTRVVVTVHPSYLLRLPDEAAKAEAYADFVEDLRRAAGAL